MVTLTTLATTKHGDRMLSDTHQAHRLVMSVFPDGVDRTGGGVLFRHHAGLLLVQHHVPCDWWRIEWAATPQSTTDVTALLDQVGDGERVAFTLVANPTFDAVINGRRVRTGIHHGPRLTEWINRRCAAAGLTDITAVAAPIGDRDGTRNGKRIRHAACLYTGTGTVTDTTLLRDAVTSGVGRGKAYGFGLLTITTAAPK